VSVLAQRTYDQAYDRRLVNSFRVTFTSITARFECKKCRRLWSFTRSASPPAGSLELLLSHADVHRIVVKSR
jgi:hypothetical protein